MNFLKLLKHRRSQLIIIAYVLILLFIPTSFFLLSLRSAAEKKTTSKSYDQTVTQPPPSGTGINQTNGNPLGGAGGSGNNLTKNSGDNSTSAQVSFGPTLKFSLKLEGRPDNQQQAKVFVGIAPGEMTTKPQYLLSYTIDLPPSGQVQDLSLAGLTVGSKYTAYIKGPAQLVSASTFNLAPTGAILNSGNPITLLSGDVNEDNIIDDADYNIVHGAIGSTSTSPKWNSNWDFNLDGVINDVDLGFILKNKGKIGDSGPWYSTINTASKSATLNTQSQIGGEPWESTPSYRPTQSGHWIWVPDL